MVSDSDLLVVCLLLNWGGGLQCRASPIHTQCVQDADTTPAARGRYYVTRLLHTAWHTARYIIDRIVARSLLFAACFDCVMVKQTTGQITAGPVTGSRLDW